MCTLWGNTRWNIWSAWNLPLHVLVSINADFMPCWLIARRYAGLPWYPAQPPIAHNASYSYAKRCPAVTTPSFIIHPHHFQCASCLMRCAPIWQIARCFVLLLASSQQTDQRSHHNHLHELCSPYKKISTADTYLFLLQSIFKLAGAGLCRNTPRDHQLCESQYHTMEMNGTNLRWWRCRRWWRCTHEHEI